MLMSLVAALGSAAFAGPVDLYGFGGEAMGRGGAGLGLADQPADTFLNPAALYRMKNGQMQVGYAVMRGDFDASPDVRWDTNQDGLIDDTDVPLQVDTDPDRADGIMFSLGRPVGKRFGVAVAGFVPVDRILRVETFEPSVPTYFMYDNRPNRYELSLGFGWQQLPGLAVGGAVEIVTRARYEIHLTLNVNAHGAVEGDEQLGELVGDMEMDVHSMTLDLVPDFAPIAAVHWDVGEAIPALDGLQLGARYRGSAGIPIDVVVDIQGNIAIEDVGELAPMIITLLVPLQLDVFDHYVPEQLAFGAAWDRDGPLALYVDVHRTAWQKMSVNVAQVVDGRIESQVVQLSDNQMADGNEHALSLRPTLSVRGGGESRMARRELNNAFQYVDVKLRLGAGFEPSPMVSQGEGTAFLDADRVMLTAGVGFEHADPFGLVAGPVAWDAFAQYHVLASGSLDVSGGDPYRAGAPVDDALIPIGGHLLALGATWSFGF